MPRKPPQGRRIKKGEVLNPNGSSAKARAIAAVKRMGVQDLAQLISDLSQSTEAQAHAIINDPDATLLQRTHAKLMIQCYVDGDVNIYRAIMDRVVGRPRESLEVSGKDGGPVQMQSVSEIEARLAVLRKQREEMGDD